MDRRPRDVIAENLRALMRRSKEAGGLVGTLEQVAKEAAVSRGVVERMTKAQTNTGVDHLQGIARAFGLQPWQLMVPDLDVENPPILAAMAEEQRRLFAQAKKAAAELSQIGE